MVLKRWFLSFISLLSLIVISAAVIAIVLFELELRNTAKLATEKFTNGFGSEANARIEPLISKISIEIRNKPQSQQREIISDIISQKKMRDSLEETYCVFSMPDKKIIHTAELSDPKQQQELFSIMTDIAVMNGGNKIAEIDNHWWFVFAEPVPDSSYWYGFSINISPITKNMESVMSPVVKFHSYIAFGIIACSLILLALIHLVTFTFMKKVMQLEKENNTKTQELSQTNLLLEIEIDLRKKIEEDLKEANIELRHISTTDKLTKIANRRKFDQTLEKEWHRHHREKHEISLLICDVDFFKKYNDAYGHQAGDECLIRVAAVMKKACKRPSDLAARYGGEEFCLILPETDVSGAILVAKNIQRLLSIEAIPHNRSSVSEVITLSIGIASAVPSEIESFGIIKEADRALYKAKELGRNRIEAHSR